MPPLLATNPAREVKRVKYATDGWHTWTTDEVRQYEARHHIGTKARLALALLLYTGVRRSDLVTLGLTNVQRMAAIRPAEDFAQAQERFRKAVAVGASGYRGS
jgi:integrase